MKIYNRTRIPDSILEPILKKAANGIGVRTSGVIVKVSAGQYRYARGNASKCCAIKIRGRWVNTDGGRIVITLPADLARKDEDPRLNNMRSFLLCATNFFNTAKHEWGHIRDFQTGESEWSKRNKGGKRPEWHKRPEEIRAENYVYDSKKKGYNEEDAYEEIMNLAIELEKFYK